MSQITNEENQQTGQNQSARKQNYPREGNFFSSSQNQAVDWFWPVEQIGRELLWE